MWLWTYPDKIFERQCPDVPQMSPYAWGNYFKRLDDVKVSARWGRFSCRLKFDGAPKVGRGAPRFIETTDWIFVEREYETPEDLKPETCNIECQFHDAVGRAYLDGLRLEEL